MDAVDLYPLNFDSWDVDTRVEMTEEAYSQDGSSLGTDGLGPCIAVAIYNSEIPAGYLAHLHPHDVPSTVETVQKSLVSVSTKAWLIGGGYNPEDPDTRQETLRSRHEALQSLLRLGILDSNIVTVWVEDPDHAAAIVLDTGNGDCRIGIQDLGHYLDNNDFWE